MELKKELYETDPEVDNMELIKELYETDIGLKNTIPDIQFKIRKRSECILLNSKNEIALLYLSKEKYHHLPGGHLEGDESIDQSLEREIKEETGCDFEKGEALGSINVYGIKKDEGLLQINYGYVGRVRGEIGEPNFTDDELQDGIELKWVSLDDAIKLIKADDPPSYHGKFIRLRELEFLKTFKNI